MIIESLTEASQKILCVFFKDLEKDWYVREIARKAKMPLKTVSWNLNKLAEMKILNREKKGRELWYSIRIDNELAGEIYAGYETREKRSFFGKNSALNMGLSEFLKSLETLQGDPILLVILFGSHARGYATKSSDVDLLVIVREGDKKDYSKWKKIIDETSDKIRARYGLMLSTSFMTLNDFRENLKKKEPFILTILKDHFILYGSGIYAKEVFSWILTRR